MTAWLRTRGIRYLAVVAAVAAATGLRYMFSQQLGQDTPFAFNWVAVIFAAWYAGAVGGVFATFLSVFGIVLVVYEPFGVLTIANKSQYHSAIVFSILGTSVSLFVGWIQRTARRAAGQAQRSTGQRVRLQKLLQAERDARVRAVHEVERRRKAEEALHQSEAQYRLLAESVPYLVWMARADGHVEYFNARWRDYTGTPTAHALGWGWEDAVHPDDRPAAISAWTNSLATGEPCEIEFRVRRHDGEHRWHIARSLPVRAADGEVVRWVGAATDLHDQKTTAAELRQANERFRLAAAAVTAAIYDWDPLTNHVERTRGLADLIGIPPEQADPTNAWWRQRIHADDRDEFARKWQETLVQGDGYEFEYRVRHADGRDLHVIDRGTLVRDDSGRLVRVVGSVMDITGRVRMETALRANEGRFRFLAEGGASLAASLDYEATLRTAAKLAVPDLADFALVHLAIDGEPRLVAAAHADPIQDAILAEVGREYRPADNPQSIIMQVLRTGSAVLVPDVTDEFLRAAAPDGTPYARIRAVGVQSLIVVPLRARDRTLGTVSLYTAAANSTRRFETADLTLAEELAGRAALALDNAHLYKEAREADRRKDEFLAMLGHELRNPLAPIVTALHLLGQSKGLDDDAIAARNTIDRQVRHLVRLVDDLLDVARITRGKVKLHRQTVELAPILVTAIETARPLLDARRHQLTVSAPEEPIWVHADPARLTQVFGNLLTNAAKYMEEGGAVTVEVELANRINPSPSASEDSSSLALGLGPNASSVIVRVRDRGVGIPAEMLPRVFDLFTQVGSALDRAQGGLGIGLSLVRSLVDLHGGRVEALSGGPGRGSEFVVHLPTVPAPVSQESGIRDGASAEPNGVAPDSWPLTPGSGVLITDDNRDAADSLSRLLQAWGYPTWVAYDGQSALAAASEHRPRVVLLDIGLGGMTGYDVARRLRADPRQNGVRLIALTGFGQEEDRRRSKEAGFDFHLVKPVDTDTLQRLLATAARGA
jgi:PAS domain S-box-containing protein